MTYLKNLSDREVRVMQICSYVVLVSAAVGSLCDGSWLVTGVFFADAAMASYVTMVAVNRKKKQQN